MSGPIVFNGGVRRRRAAAWLLSVPLMVVGSEVAHVLAYRWVYPQAQVRLRALLATGHAYMLGPAGFWPVLFGVVGGIELVAVSWVLVGSVSRRSYAPVPAWAFGFVPPVGFVVQEFLAADGRYPVPVAAGAGANVPDRAAAAGPVRSGRLSARAFLARGCRSGWPASLAGARAAEACRRRSLAGSGEGMVAAGRGARPGSCWSRSSVSHRELLIATATR